MTRNASSAMSLSLLSTLAALLLVQTPVAAQIEINGAGGETVRIGPGGISVKSGGDNVQIGTGQGKATVKVKSGHKNQVRVQSAKVKAGNKVSSGTKVNVVSPQNALAENLVIMQNNTNATYNCRGGRCSITSNNCDIVLNGVCSQLVITGNNNNVVCDSVGQVSVLGNNNQLTYNRGLNGQEPVVSILGNNNEAGRSQN
ncbi:MAG: DUF3060 domain-containing protein [Candidatus Melainabacteria bacterium]|nr:DUF3060 domain-containing protein [Candidatus Melainabacteria bacterium]